MQWFRRVDFFCNPTTFRIAAIIVKYCYPTGSWLLELKSLYTVFRLLTARVKIVAKRDYLSTLTENYPCNVYTPPGFRIQFIVSYQVLSSFTRHDLPLFAHYHPRSYPLTTSLCTNDPAIHMNRRFDMICVRFDLIYSDLLEDATGHMSPTKSNSTQIM